MPFTQPKTRAATYDDLCRLPDNIIGEIIDGDSIDSPQPAPCHVLAPDWACEVHAGAQNT